MMLMFFFSEAHRVSQWSIGTSPVEGESPYITVYSLTSWIIPFQKFIRGVTYDVSWEVPTEENGNRTFPTKGKVPMI